MTDQELIALMLDALKSVEFIGPALFSPNCPYCHREKKNLHKWNCKLKAAIDAAERNGKQP